MNHKEKCRQLKNVRKQIADQIGIDLHQTECTYEGECRGTCPKCAQEEKILNKALMTGTIAVSAIALSACGAEGGGYEARADRLDRIEDTQNKCDKKANYDKEIDEIVGEEVYYPEEGDVAYVDPGEYELAGDVVEYIPDDYELDGEALPMYGEYTYSVEDAEKYVKYYIDAPIVEFDHYDDNDGQYVVIHCYEEVDDDDESSHTSTLDWITVDLETLDAETFDGTKLNLLEYYYDNY